MAQPHLPQFLTLKQSAARLQVSVKTLTRAIAQGGLRSHRLGRQIRISDDDLAAYLAARRR